MSSQIEAMFQLLDGPKMLDANPPSGQPSGLSDENWSVLKDALRWPAIMTVDEGLHLTSWDKLDGIINLCVTYRGANADAATALIKQIAFSVPPKSPVDAADEYHRVRRLCREFVEMQAKR
ncbi:hypothetical protein HOU02_gp285 [Caulobacter phage CcrBL9]|uniref:Uncharacterized protein n=1 Tax=Caulobacter phage CcrBL9 TaxID=2283270 RepID=A0A385ECR3_9CAUD|nr:hypothetical protein HOU02_gp285 [Caulobacter phage CcrBL9]AXQ69440.1 hypothetical protein CcrBL9_gp416 [Caulobacter phage CcrBL9]